MLSCILMATQEDDEGFSFPTTKCSPPRFIGSPRLWRSSSNSLYLHQIKLTKRELDQQTMLSYIKNKDGDENMDVIWEDLNYEEEICAVSRRINDDGDFDREIGAACGGGKRRSMVVFVNVLKKLLLLHHTSRHWIAKK
ncbi:hypothetical protein E3N88_45660 [Mikania micrantha]|uniref:Uncharacterized protein n=1 Tax=Mikania micrantha TaxID=192012 RepID=A0A5N6L8H4_9ASTR|nr:hypothetical protein E3N88_45660 [Mikania micrantha]